MMRSGSMLTASLLLCLYVTYAVEHVEAKINTTKTDDSKVPYVQTKGILLTQPRDTQVAFSAHRSTNLDASSASATVSYDHIWTNIGGGLDVSTGVFTAPVTGTYMFTFSGYTGKDRHSYVDLFYGNGNKASTAHVNTDTHAMSGTSAILRLNIGDKAWMELRQGGLLYAGGEIYISFTGHIL